MGLSTKDLAQIKELLTAGKRPRVVFTASAGQIAGQIGHVVRLDDPAKQEDWILVKFGTDVLPFPPADLAIPARGGAAAAKTPAAKAAPAKLAKAEPEFKVVRENTNGKPKREPVAAPQRAAAEDNVPRNTPPPRQETTVSTPDSAQPAAPEPRRPAAGPKGPKAKPVPSFTVTLSYTEGEWMVGAVQGSRTLAKPYVIKPSEALKMVGLLDVPGVHEAVEQIMSAERSQAQAQAEKLRAELADLEAKLAELGA